MVDAPPGRGDPERGGRRLASATSAYLRSAQEQAIDWRPWGEEPFDVARRTRRPVLLDIGAAWCHWCHVMDEGTYSDPEVARLLNRHFVAVKVDRDEHPEVDRRYQRQVGALTGEGGWPLTAFLTPEGAVFLGGTYFPPEDGMGRPGFRRVLKEVARLWSEERDKVEGNIEAIRASLDRLQRPPAARALPSETFLAGIRAQLDQSYDPVNAGFGHAPKFPHPMAVAFLLANAFATGEVDPAERARSTLLRMALGGMYDHVGGGFHRYSVDEGWHIPHFEKMAVDNAALLAAYVEGARCFADPVLAATARGTLGWITKTLAHPDGGFGASQDADNAPGDDGSYFTWSRSELKSVLEPEDARLVTRVFGVGSDGRMPHDPDRNVLFRLMTPAEAAEGSSIRSEDAPARLERAIDRLRSARTQRPMPFVDLARYANLNGAIVRALATAGPFARDVSAVPMARRAADAFLARGYERGRGVAHRLGTDGADGFGLLEDQAEFALGLIELAVVAVDPRYLTVAAELLELIDGEFRGEEGLFQDLAPRLYDGPKVGALPPPSYPLEDSPHLAANSAVALAFLRFDAVTGRSTWAGKARAMLPAIHARIARSGLFAASAAWATTLVEIPVARVVIEGSGADAEALELAARSAWHPNLVVFRGLPPPPFRLPEEIAGAGPATTPRALLCLGTRCLAPITDPSKLAPALGSAARSVGG
ncbi:MAG: thioredoxin domain-containing protein [Thermoplasmata archaeon]